MHENQVRWLNGPTAPCACTIMLCEYPTATVRWGVFGVRLADDGSMSNQVISVAQIVVKSYLMIHSVRPSNGSLSPSGTG